MWWRQVLLGEYNGGTRCEADWKSLLEYVDYRSPPALPWGSTAVVARRLRALHAAGWADGHKAWLEYRAWLLAQSKVARKGLRMGCPVLDWRIRDVVPLAKRPRLRRSKRSRAAGA